MDKNQIAKRAQRRRAIVYGQEYHDLFAQRVNALLKEYDAIPDEQKPVGKDFENWIYRQLADANYVLTKNSLADWVEAVSQALSWRTGGVDPTTEKKEKIKTAEKATTWDSVPTEQLDRDGIYAPPVAHTRYSPENPGVQMRRIKDKVYQDPITGTVYHWETGVHQQTTPLWNEGWENGTHPNLLDVEQHNAKSSKGKPAYDYDHPYPGDDRDPDKTTNDSGWSDNPVAFRGLDYHKDKFATIKQRIKKADIFAPTVMSTRTCPDHPGTQMLRVTDNIRQCPVDHQVYDYGAGFTTSDGVEHTGGSISEQTPSIPGYYSSPHPSLSLFPSSASAKIRGLSKYGSDLRGVEQRFIFDLSHALKGDQTAAAAVARVVDIASKGDQRTLTQIIQDVYITLDKKRSETKTQPDQIEKKIDQEVEEALQSVASK